MKTEMLFYNFYHDIYLSSYIISTYANFLKREMLDINTQLYRRTNYFTIK